MREKAKDELTIPVTVEFEEVDTYGIGHHARMIAYLERARLRYFLARGHSLEKSDVHPVLYHVEMQFKKPVELLDQLEVSVYLKRREEHRVILGYRVRRDGALVARASTTLAFVDARTKRLVPVPEQLFEKEM
jgi:acyl-CoA thioester hydrolase